MGQALSVEDLLDSYRTMKTIREFEDRVHVEFTKGGIPGFVHLYAGEEASAAGIGMQLRDDDRVASNHRGHGHCIAKGVEVNGMMAEIYGKKTGICHGKGGSMHIADLDTGMMGANGIVGGRPPRPPTPRACACEQRCLWHKYGLTSYNMFYKQKYVFPLDYSIFG